MRNGVFVLVGVIIARDPKSLVVAGEIEFRLLVRNDEIGQVFLGWELIAETEAVVEKPKGNYELPIIDRLLFENDLELTVLISDRFHLAPNRLPGFVLNSGLGLDD